MLHKILGKLEQQERENRIFKEKLRNMESDIKRVMAHRSHN